MLQKSFCEFLVQFDAGDFKHILTLILNAHPHPEMEKKLVQKNLDSHAKDLYHATRAMGKNWFFIDKAVWKSYRSTNIFIWKVGSGFWVPNSGYWISGTFFLFCSQFLTLCPSGMPVIYVSLYFEILNRWAHGDHHWKIAVKHDNWLRTDLYLLIERDYRHLIKRM